MCNLEQPSSNTVFPTEELPLSSALNQSSSVGYCKTRNSVPLSLLKFWGCKCSILPLQTQDEDDNLAKKIIVKCFRKSNYLLAFIQEFLSLNLQSYIYE